MPMILRKKLDRALAVGGLLLALAACENAENTLATRAPTAPEVAPAAPLASLAPSAPRLPETIAPAEDYDGTRAVLALQAANIPFDRAPYQDGQDGAENIVLSYGTGAAELVVGARFAPTDADSACGPALLRAYELLRSEAPPQHLTVRLVLFGGQAGNRDDGAAFYAEASPPETVLGMLNLSVCGAGRVFSVWDVEGAAERSLIVDALLQAGDSEGLSVGFHDGAPVGARDHAGFQASGIPAVGVSVVPLERASADSNAAPGGGSIELAAQLIASTVSVFDAFLAAENR